MTNVFPQFVASRRAAGFNMIEVMFAMGIFTVGFVAVAAIFPVGMMLQRETLQDTHARHFAASTKAIVQMRGFSEAILEAQVTQSETVTAVPQALTAPAPFGWSLADRSYNAIDPVNERRYFWVPLFFDADDGPTRDWRVYIFVVKNRSRGDYSGSPTPQAVPDDPNYVPRVVGTNAARDGNRFNFNNANPRRVRAGDKVLDNQGYVYRVARADNNGIEVDGMIPQGSNGIWYAHPGNLDVSTFVDIIVLVPTDNNNLIR